MNKINKNTTVSRMSIISDEIVKFYKDSGITDDNCLSKIMNQIEKLSVELGEVVKRIVVKTKLDILDANRDHALRSILKLLNAFALYDDNTIQTAAAHLKALFLHFGKSLSQLNYDTESALINSLLLNFGKEEEKANIALIPGLALIIDKLSKAEDEFKDGKTKYQNEKTRLQDHPNATLLKIEIGRIINTRLISYLNIQKEYNPTEYSSFYNHVETVINNNNQNIKKGTSKKELQAGE